MLWILISLLFCWCVVREIRGSFVAPPGFDFPSPVNVSYLILVATLAVLFAWPTVHRWYFERWLSQKATELADQHRATVHCNTLIDTMLDTEMLSAGHASPTTGRIVIQKPWCSTLMSYLAHPDRASEQEIQSLNLFTHESMHVRGEMNEAGPNAKQCSATTGRRNCSGCPTQRPGKTRSSITMLPIRCAVWWAACRVRIIRRSAPPGRPWTSI